MSKEYDAPPDVKLFIKKLGKSVKAKKTEELLTLYEEFTSLTEKFFYHCFFGNHCLPRFYKGSKWPSPDSVSGLVDADRNSLILYKDLYFRHMYSR